MKTSAMIVASVVALQGCVVDGTGYQGKQIDCSGLTCDWVTVEGNPRYGATWHDGDFGVDLSGEGRIVVEQRMVLIPPFTRQLPVQASMVRDANVTMRFEFEFYAPGSASGATFWDRAPVLLKTRVDDVFEVGVFHFRRDVLVPSEGAAVIVRIVKEGSGRAMVDELTMG